MRLLELFGEWLELESMMKRSMGWAWRVKSMFGSLTAKKAVLDDGKLKNPSVSGLDTECPVYRNS